MVFLTFLGMFTNQYVPIWMNENETNHMNNVVGQLSNLKSGIDLQILSNNDQIASAPMFAPIQLHAEGVPVFASPTMGVLSFTSDGGTVGPSVKISYSYRVNGTNYKLDSTNGGLTGGSLEFYGPNRYYIQQNVTMENGAIVLKQADGEAMLSGIAIRLVNNSGNWSVKITLISLTGISKAIGGFGTKSITSALEYTYYQKLTNTTGNQTRLTIITKYPDAWKRYYSDLLNKSGVPYQVNNVVKSSSAPAGNPGYRTVTVKIPNVYSLEYTKAVATISIADIGV
jgi:hypothetical protein